MDAIEARPAVQRGLAVPAKLTGAKEEVERRVQAAQKLLV
jgi:hypothetical protein